MGWMFASIQTSSTMTLVVIGWRVRSIARHVQIGSVVWGCTTDCIVGIRVSAAGDRDKHTKVVVEIVYAHLLVVPIVTIHSTFQRC